MRDIRFFLDKINNSLKWKLISIIAGILLLTVSGIGVISYTKTAASVREDIDRLSVQVLKQANMNLDRYYSEYDMAFLMLGNSLEVREWLRLSASPVSSEFIRYYDRIKENYLNRMFLQYPEILSVSLYKPGGGEHHFVNAHTLPLTYSLQDEPYFSQTGNYDKVKFITGFSDHYLDADSRSLRLPVLTLFKQFYSGYLKMDISLTASQKVMEQIHIVDSDSAVVMDEDGTIIHHSRPGEVMGHMDEHLVEKVNGKREGSFYDQTRNELIVYQTIPLTGWKIIAMLPYSQVAKSILYTRNMMIALAIGALAVSVVLTYFAASSITRRISGLRGTMKQMQYKNDFAIRAEVAGRDEVADLSKSFNNLLEHLEQSVADLTETRVLQHRAVISALQSQINSHFLYNTLETINSMAVIGRQPQIGLVAVSLSSMLRYTSNFKDDQVLLADEVRHVEHYLNIMKIRYKDELTYELQVPGELLEALCTKALLQPLVENSIKHTREETGAAVHIIVAAAATADGRLHLTVRDNGPGFGEEVLARLVQEQADCRIMKPQATRVGLSNLIERLHMFYGGEAVIHFGNGSGGEGEGAVVELFLPLHIRSHV